MPFSVLSIIIYEVICANRSICSNIIYWLGSLMDRWTDIKGLAHSYHRHRCKKREKMTSLTAEECGADFNHSLLFSPFSVQPTQWTSDLNDQKWVGRNHVRFLFCMWTDTWMSLFSPLILQLWWHRTGDSKLWNTAPWAAVPEGTIAGLQLCKFKASSHLNKAVVCFRLLRLRSSGACWTVSRGEGQLDRLCIDGA